MVAAAVLSGVYGAFALAVLALYLLRRNKQPLKARGYIMTVISTVMGLAHFIGMATFFEVPPSNPNCPTYTNVQDVTTNLYFVLWGMPMLIRAGILVYQYHLNKFKLQPSKLSSRLFAIRPYVESSFWQFVFLFTLTGLHCAITFGVSSVTITNPCRLMDYRIILALAAVYVVILIIVIVAAWPVSDIFWIKGELILEIVAVIPLMVLWTLASYNIISVVSQPFVWALIFGTTVNMVVVPLLMTYQSRWKEFAVDHPMDKDSFELKHIRLNSSSAGAQVGIETSEKSSQSSGRAANRWTVRFKAPPNLDKVKLSELLANPKFAAAFEEFSVRALCAENIAFYKDLSRTSEFAAMDETTLQSECRRVVDQYIAEGCPLQVNLSDQVRSETLEQHQQRPSDISVFDPAMAEVFWMMRTNLFPAWKKDPAFLNLYIATFGMLGTPDDDNAQSARTPRDSVRLGSLTIDFEATPTERLV